MSKEYSEALEMLKNRALSDLDSISKTAIPICEKSNDEVMKSYEVLKQALQRLEAIDNSDPSEALESLDYLHNSKIYEYDDDDEYFIDNYRVVEAALLKAQEAEVKKDEKID